jgi:hypothetical protein
MDLCGFLEVALRLPGDAVFVSERTLVMTTILVLNAASSLLALVGVAGFLALRERRARRETAVRVLYVTTVAPERLSRH